MQKGTYIVIEGNDGTGKSTQVELLARYLSEFGHETVITEEPGSVDLEKSTPIANYLRSVIKNGNLARDAEINLALFSSARRELWQHKILPALTRGAVVLSARNYFSTLAYQGRGEGLDEQHIIDITKLFTHDRYISPDLMLVLTLEDEAERTNRIGLRGRSEHPDAFEVRGQEFQDKVNQAYIELSSIYNLEVISCLENGRNKSIEEIHGEIIALPFIQSLGK
jgi:dTMP kinase